MELLVRCMHRPKPPTQSAASSPALSSSFQTFPRMGQDMGQKKQTKISTHKKYRKQAKPWRNQPISPGSCNKWSKSFFRPLAFPRSPSAASPAKRVAVESEEIPTRVQFSAKPETERWWEFLSWRAVRDSNPRPSGP